LEDEKHDKKLTEDDDNDDSDDDNENDDNSEDDNSEDDNSDDDDDRNGGLLIPVVELVKGLFPRLFRGPS
jgi:hypothetical protein